jgi:hypothetical protein
MIGNPDYVYAFPNLDVTGSTGVGWGMSHQLTGSIHDPDFASPVSWSWYLDGNLTSSTKNTFDGVARGDPGSIHEVDAFAVDGNGRQLSAAHMVTTCEGTQIEC